MITTTGTLARTRPIPPTVRCFCRVWPRASVSSPCRSSKSTEVASPCWTRTEDDAGVHRQGTLEPALRGDRLQRTDVLAVGMSRDRLADPADGCREPPVDLPTALLLADGTGAGHAGRKLGSTTRVSPGVTKGRQVHREIQPRVRTRGVRAAVPAGAVHATGAVQHQPEVSVGGVRFPDRSLDARRAAWIWM